MACFTCHLSLDHELRAAATCRSRPTGRPTSHQYEGEETRNFATYNPQVARDEMFQLGRHQTTKGNHHRAGPLDLGAGPVLDQHQPRADLRPAAADQRGRLLEPGLRAALPAHRAHDRDQDLHRLPPVRRRTTTTRSWRSCCCSGTNFVNFVGLNAWIGLEGGFEAVRVTEWDEPQAVIGSYLHRYAYPDFWRAACRAQRAAS